MIQVKNWVHSHLLLHQVSGCPWEWKWPCSFIFLLPLFGLEIDHHANAWNTAHQETGIATWSLRFWPLLLFGGWPSRSQQTGHTCDLKLSQMWESGSWSQVIGIACPFHTLLWALDCHMADTNCPTSWVLNFVDLSYESSCLNDWDPSRLGTRLLMSVFSPVCAMERTREKGEIAHFSKMARWSLSQQQFMLAESRDCGQDRPWL